MRLSENKRFFILACFLFLSSITVRWIYSTAVGKLLLYPDSQEYIRAADKLSRLQIDIIRVPVYPIFIKVAGLISTGAGALWGTVILQVVLSSVMVAILFRLALILLGNWFNAFIVAFYCSINITLMNWDFLILTESLTVFLMAAFALVFCLFIKKGDKKYLIWIYILCALLIYTKPFYMPIPLIVFVILEFYSIFMGRRKQILLFGMIALLCIYSSMGIYSYINLKQNGYFGLSNVSAINSLGKVLQYRMYDLGDNKELINLIEKEIRENNGATPDPAEFIGKYKLYGEKNKEVADYAGGIIKKNPVRYVKETIKLMLRESKYWKICIDYNSKNYTKAWIVSIFDFTSKLPIINSFLFVFALVFIECLYLLYKIIRSKQIDWIWITLTLLIIYQFSMTILGSHGEYPRLVVPVFVYIQMMMFKYIFSAIDRIYKWGRQGRKRIVFLE